VLCTSDGRRGYLHHLAVAADSRRLGIGRALAAAGLSAMTAQGLPKCHLFVWRTNAEAQAFWKRVGWVERDDIVMMSTTLAPPAEPA
jgi:ribosomal protein S18 acetylase RimI-like enzyme